jgi:hypothetical protein
VWSVKALSFILSIVCDPNSGAYYTTSERVCLSDRLTAGPMRLGYVQNFFCVHFVLRVISRLHSLFEIYL